MSQEVEKVLKGPKRSITFWWQLTLLVDTSKGLSQIQIMTFCQVQLKPRLLFAKLESLKFRSDVFSLQFIEVHFRPQKNVSSKKFWSKKMFVVRNKFRVRRKFRVQKNFHFEKILAQKRMLGPKFFLVQQILDGKKNLSAKKILGPKKYWVRFNSNWGCKNFFGFLKKS